MADTLDEFGSSDVDGPASGTDYTRKGPVQEMLSIIAEGGESSCCELEPESSPVDEACWFLTCDTKLSETSFNWDEPEPRSSAVDAEIVQLPANEADVKGSLLAGQYIHDYDATKCEAHILSKNIEGPPIPENSTCDSGGKYPLKPDMKSTLQYVCKSDVTKIDVFNFSLQNGDHISSSESASVKKITSSESAKPVKKITSSKSATSVKKITSSKSAISVKKNTSSGSAKSVKKITSSESARSVKKGSLSEMTGMEISANELPVDSENTLSEVPVIDITESEPKSSSGRNSDGSQLVKDRKLNQEIAASLRQRQVPPAAAVVGAPEDDQSSVEQSSLIVYTHRPGGVPRSLPVLDRQVNNLHERPHVRFLHAQRMTRLGMLHYPYNASFMVMVGICLFTVFILLSRLFFILDIPNRFF
ncbi:hypothetical protein BsWGS_28202 [Bradybaena similaris]